MRGRFRSKKAETRVVNEESPEIAILGKGLILARVMPFLREPETRRPLFTPPAFPYCYIVLSSLRPQIRLLGFAIYP